MNRLIVFSFVVAAAAGFACELSDSTAASEVFDEAEVEAEQAGGEPVLSERPDMPDETRQGDGEAGDARVTMVEIDVSDNQACVDCHPGAAAQWQGSLHQRAWVEPAFQDSYAREPLEFCRGCHAPRADPALEPPPELAAIGVDCVSCHVRDGVVHTGPGPDVAPHGLVRSPDFGETACADCHQFEFPRKAHRAPGTLMQKTMLEHERSEWSALTCADCHFPVNDVGVGRDHGLAISRNADLLRASLLARAAWVGGDRVRFGLEPDGVGHSFPTGDLFRRLELRVEQLDAAGEVLATEHRFLARQFESETDGHGRIAEAPDERLLGAVEIEVPFVRREGVVLLRWCVLYQRVDSRDHEAPERSKLAGEVELASGTLTR